MGTGCPPDTIVSLASVTDSAGHLMSLALGSGAGKAENWAPLLGPYLGTPGENLLFQMTDQGLGQQFWGIFLVAPGKVGNVGC